MNTTFVQGQPQSPLAIQAALPHVVIAGDQGRSMGGRERVGA